MITKTLAAFGAAGMLLAATAVAADCAGAAHGHCSHFLEQPTDPHPDPTGNAAAYEACVANYMRACQIELEPADPGTPQ